jgi:hypothetical protein
MTYLSDDRLTPGVIDGAAEHAFSTGACAALAYVMNEATGWKIVGITDSHNVHDGTLGGGSSLHWGVMRPDGKFIDIDGAHDMDDIVDRYHGEADDEEAAWGIGTRADIQEWYVESQGAPISFQLARTFVDPVLERIREAESEPKP